MKAWRLTLLLVLLAVAAAALWVRRGPDRQEAAGQDDDAAQAAYDYEAHDVVLRQMGPDGRLQFQVQAREITQLPDGRISALGLTLYHDPPGSEPGGPDRWTLTADSGELPAKGGVITLAGKVRARGKWGGRTTVTFATEHLQYDMAKQEFSSDDEVEFTLGGNTMRGSGLRANIRTSNLELGSETRATLVPR